MGRATCNLSLIPLGGGRWLVYAPLRRVAFAANARMVNALASLERGGETLDPAALDWLRRLELADAGPEPALDARASGDPKPVALTLLLTTACNLRCTYCYARAGERPPEWMSLEVARRGIDFVLANALELGEGVIEVAFHGGGEPSQHWEVLTAAVRHARERCGAEGLKLATAIATNGLLSGQQADWVARHLDTASVSFDGMPELHNRFRVLPGGGGSAGRVARTLERFDRAGFPYGIRMTVTAEGVARLPESVEYLCRRFNAGEILAEPVYRMGRWREGAGAESAAFVEAYLAAREVAALAGRRLRFSAARPGARTRHFCSASRDGFALLPSGAVSACYEVFSEDSRWADVFCYGRLTAGGFEFDRKRLKRLRDLEVGRRAECAGCFARWDCAGDCAHKRLETGAARCTIIRELTKQELLANIAASGGVCWRGDVEA